MTELLILRGIPASGKSTFARGWVSEAPNRIRVNRDDIRFQLYGAYRGDIVNEDTVTKIQNAQITAALRGGVSVVLDNTNTVSKHLKPIIRIANRYGVEIVVRDFPIDVEIALDRNASRKRFVPESVIRSMCSRVKNGFPPLEITQTSFPPAPPHSHLIDDAIIVDIDGTLALHGSRNPYDTSRYHEDSLNANVAEIVSDLSSSYHVVIMSGRSEDYQTATLIWLRENGIWYDDIFMRASGDFRDDAIVKNELYENHVRGRYNVVGVFDDRNRVVDMWRAKGLTVFQVADGDF